MSLHTPCSVSLRACHAACRDSARVYGNDLLASHPRNVIIVYTMDSRATRDRSGEASGVTYCRLKYRAGAAPSVFLNMVIEMRCRRGEVATLRGGGGFLDILIALAAYVDARSSLLVARTAVVNRQIDLFLALDGGRE